ncbi:MAG TPA: helix-turn-helix domain-containing protein [Rhodocyclaceae bacterium]
MNTLDLQAAADFLGLHKNTLQARAKAGEIPGAKIGKEWRFIDVDLAQYLRDQYPANKIEEKQSCRSTKSKTSGTSISRHLKGASELDALLEHPTKRKPSASTTNSRQNSGIGKSVVRIFPTLSHGG